MRRAALLLALAGCNSILGIGDFTTGGDDTTGDGGIEPDAEVIPPNTVIGHLRYDFVDYDGEVTTVGQDLTATTIQAYIPDPSEPTGFAVVDGTGEADGTFTIEDVPDGMTYYLKIVAPGSGGGRWYVTDDHSPDLDRAASGRSDAVTVSNPTTVTVQLDGLQPWFGDWNEYGGDTLIFEAFGVGTESWNMEISDPEGDWPTYGETTTDFTLDWSVNAWSWRPDGRPAEVTTADPVYITHHRDGTAADSFGRKQRLTRSIDLLESSAVTIEDGQPATLTGTFAPIDMTESLRIAFNRPAWDATYSDGLSAVLLPPYVSLLVNPYGEHNLILGADAFSVAFDNRAGNSPENLQTIDITYGDPYPASWTRHIFQEYPRYRYYKLPGTTLPRPHGTGTRRMMELTTPFPATPDLQPVGTVTIGGIDGIAGGAIDFDGVAPVHMSWSAVATANHYEVLIWRLYVDGSRTRSSTVARLSTRATSIDIPAEIFTGGQFWTFFVTTVRDGGNYADGILEARGFPYTEAGVPTGQIRLSSTCGDGTPDLGEDCDDAGTSATCDVDCTAVACGDGIRNAAAGEVCDSVRDSVACDSDCTANVCGDGHVNFGTEECDDGNTTSDGNGCGGNCRGNNVCGNGRVEVWLEECDDGDDVDSGNGCSATCKRNRGYCGDDVVQPGAEICDPPMGDGSCDDDCSPNVCGDGYVNFWTENCDDGDQVDGNGCPNDCTVGGELCIDNIDNDADGQTDCADPDCFGTGLC